MTIRVVALVAGLCSACSFIDVKPPPDRLPRSGQLDCTSSRFLPATDTVWALLGLGGAVTIEMLRDQPAENAGSIDGLGTDLGLLTVILIGTITGVSAIHGYSNTGRCRSMKAQLAREP